MEFKKVAIIGAGAVGSYMLWGLSQRNDIDLCVVADGKRKERIQRDGIVINDVKYQPKVCTPEEARGVDLLFVTVKYTALRETLKDIKTLADSHTVIVSLMNGVDSEEIISEVVDKSQIVYSLIKVASERKENSVRFNPETTVGLIYGELDANRSKERIEALNNLFEGTGLHYRATDYILNEMWSKFLLNIGNNLIQAVIGTGVGAYTDSEHMAFLKTKMREEVLSIAKARGIDFNLVDEKSMVGSEVKPRARYSTLQDIDAKRHTEIDMFSGSVVRMGRELGIPTPYNEYTFHAIKALEEKNDGKFDYE